MTWNVQWSPSWLYSAPRMSKVGPSRLATSVCGSTNRNSALGSMNLRISHGQEVRSTWIFLLVIHFTAQVSPRRGWRSLRGTLPALDRTDRAEFANVRLL